MKETKKIMRSSTHRKIVMSIPEEPDTHLTEVVSRTRHCSLIPTDPFNKIIFLPTSRFFL